jgi:hypothetical protein
MKAYMSPSTWSLILVLLAFLASCTGPIVSPLTPSPTGILSPTPKSELPTNTPVTKLPTDAPVSKPTVVIPTRRSSPTPVATMTADKEQALVLSLLQDNGKCRLPCWWGFTPEETAWQVAESFFLSHGKRIGTYRDSQGTVYSVDFYIPNHGSRINQDYYTTNGDGIDVIIVRAVPAVHDEKLDYGDAQLARDWSLYMLPQMLTTYGQPSEVFLETFTGTPDGGRPPFSLLLFYPENGILVRYHGPAEKTGETLRLCPSQADVGPVLWSPEYSMTLDRLANLGNELVGDMSGFHSLEEATGMSVDEFYQTFKNANKKTCFETPVDMW